MSVETAERMLQLIHDLGACQDSREILVAAARHFRVLFGEYQSGSFLMDEPSSEGWYILPLENPYAPSWGGVAHHMIPAATDTDEIVRRLGKNVSGTLDGATVLQRLLFENKEPFWCYDDVAAVRLSALTGSPSRCFVGACWERPITKKQAWYFMGYPDREEFDESHLKLFATAVEVTSRMAQYPSLVNYVERTEKINHSVRRNIVHDLKTPITVIQGYAETLQHKEIIEDPEIRTELIEGISDSCNRLQEDIRDILEPVETAWVPKPTRFDLSSMLHKVVTAERHTERSKGHILTLVGADSPVEIDADQRKVRRVFENLLSNAVKYSPGHGKQVEIELRVTGPVAQISFRDEGIGMSDVQLARVLSDGGRAVDDGLGIEGTGFGLTSVQTVLAAHGGKLKASSQPGYGSTFTVMLPIVDRA